MNAALVAVALAVAASLGLSGAPPTGQAVPPVRAVTTGNHSELVKTIPITRRRGAKPKVAMSLEPGTLGPLATGEQLRLNGEVQVTLTCYAPGLERCIGHSYSYSPHVRTRLVLASSAKATSGPKATPLSTWGGLTCSAHRPNRNHHCVLVYPKITASIGPQANLPCRLARCFVNLVLEADHGGAGPHDRLIVGTDRPDGTVSQDLGRLNAIEIQTGADFSLARYRSARRRTRTLPIKEDGGRRVVYSVRIPALRRGDALAVQAHQVTDLSKVPYTAYVSDEMVLARSPHAVNPARPSLARLRGYITEANGFNCTQGPSQFQSPCTSVKAGAIEIRRTALDRRGQPRPLYVNLVSRSKPKHVSAAPGDVARVDAGGSLSVVRYRSRSARSASSRAKTLGISPR